MPFARRILGSLREPFEINGLTLHIGASIGIALAPRDAPAAEKLIKYADLALYEVKAAGRNTVRVYQPSMGSQVDRRLVLEQELREALARGQLTLVYQPQIDTRHRTVIGLEALLRWNHPELGVVTPAEFIPIAEDSGLIAEIGAWVLEEACRHVQLHDEKLSIAVNLSPVQVMTQDLSALIDEVLARTGLAAHRLELEITESVLLNEEATTLLQMAALQQRGVRIVLDDFGTGFASMAYLLRFHFAKIKIDRSFVHLLREQGRKRAIVRAIIEMSQQMGTRVLAEGVETESELQMLESDGCTEVQGYYYARPLNELDLVRFLCEWAEPELLAAPSEFGALRAAPDLLLPVSRS